MFRRFKSQSPESPREKKVVWPGNSSNDLGVNPNSSVRRNTYSHAQIHCHLAPLSPASVQDNNNNKSFSSVSKANKDNGFSNIDTSVSTNFKETPSSSFAPSKKKGFWSNLFRLKSRKSPEKEETSILWGKRAQKHEQKYRRELQKEQKQREKAWKKLQKTTQTGNNNGSASMFG